MGAMENKSLNVFNSRLVLATPDSASDGDFGRIEGVVGPLLLGLGILNAHSRVPPTSLLRRWDHTLTPCRPIHYPVPPPPQKK